MAITLATYSNSNSKVQNITVDFNAEFLAASLSGTSNALQYFFKFTTSARDIDNETLPPKIVKDLSDLPVINRSNSAQKWRSATNSTNVYENIKTMLVDYAYDYVYGHEANQWGSNCTEQKQIKFT